MKILVTGAAGFVGSHLCDYLLSQKHHVVGIDNMALGRIKYLSNALEHDNFTFNEFDLLDKNRLFNLFETCRFETVFHLAANSDISKGSNDPTIDLNSNFITTFNILESMRIYKCKNIIFSSTSAIYGDVDVPISEDYGPLKPSSLYGASKLSAESYIFSYSELFNMKSLIFRFPNVIGNRLTHGVIFDFIKKLKNNPKKLEILGNGLQEKPYIHISDLISSMMHIWNVSNESKSVYNLGVDTATKVNKIAKEIIKAMHLSDVEINYTGGSQGWKGDVPKFRYNLKKLHSTGWQAQFTSDEAVKQTIKDILKNWKQ